MSAHHIVLVVAAALNAVLVVGWAWFAFRWWRLRRVSDDPIIDLCAHDWHSRDAKRWCPKCGREQWLFGNRFPQIGEPALEWKNMGFRPPQRGEEP